MNNLFAEILTYKKFILMAEIKIKSPVEGVLGKMEDIEKIAKEYQRGGADMISAVTEEKLFGGDLSIVKKIKKVTKLPALCKDFIREASNRYEGVFNVVFLDYVGSHIHNRDDVIEAIAKRRLSNNSIFSFARELRTDKRPIFENARNIFIEQGYEVSDIASQNYPSQIDFHSYLLRK